MEMITLKNGTKEVKSLVLVVSLVLKSLIEDRPIALYEFVMKCKDSNHQFFGNNGDYLREHTTFLDNNDKIHDSIKNITLNSIEGEGLDMALVKPY